ICHISSLKCLLSSGVSPQNGQGFSPSSAVKSDPPQAASVWSFVSLMFYPSFSSLAAVGLPCALERKAVLLCPRRFNHPSLSLKRSHPAAGRIKVLCVHLHPNKRHALAKAGNPGRSAPHKWVNHQRSVAV